jgi:2-enoate reductase
LGGGIIGCETALWLAKQGYKVTIIERLPALMKAGLPVPYMNKAMLLNLLVLHKVTILTNSCVEEITDVGVITRDRNLKRHLTRADTVVLQLGLKAEDTLYAELQTKVPNCYAIGDCQQPRNIMAAIWDAYEVARVI